MPMKSIVDAIVRQMQCDPDSIQPDTSLESLGIDSLKAINILFDLEEEFDIEIPNEIIAEMKTVTDIDEALKRIISSQ